MRRRSVPDSFNVTHLFRLASLVLLVLVPHLSAVVEVGRGSPHYVDLRVVVVIIGGLLFSLWAASKEGGGGEQSEQKWGVKWGVYGAASESSRLGALRLQRPSIS